MEGICHWRFSKYAIFCIFRPWPPSKRTSSGAPTGRTRAAAEELDLSYRAAWGLLLDANALAGAPLAELQRGRGARLTRYGSSLVKGDDQLRQAVGSLSERLGIAPDAGAAAGAAPRRGVASHHPVGAVLLDRDAPAAGRLGEKALKGSEESLAVYARGGADIAGFHVEMGSPSNALRRYLKPKRDRLLRFADREQGLFVRHGNPRKLRSLADVARYHARFINRQKGAGTRILTDRLLSEAGVAPERVRGYEAEEYTHLAVAATIAAGRADAGVGVRAAAAQFGLDFVPLAREHYWLVMRTRTAAGAQAQSLMRALAGKPLSRLARGKPGYYITGAGKLYSVEEAFA